MINTKIGGVNYNTSIKIKELEENMIHLKDNKATIVHKEYSDNTFSSQQEFIENLFYYVRDNYSNNTSGAFIVHARHGISYIGMIQIYASGTKYGSVMLISYGEATIRYSTFANAKWNHKTIALA